LNETLELSFSGLIGFNDFDMRLRSYMKYSLNDQVSLGAGAYLFIPDQKQKIKYGTYRDLSSFYINAKYCF